MRGYEVVTSDDRVVGRVVEVREGFVIVESGRLRKSRRPVPRAFVHPADDTARAVVTVPRSVLVDAPELDRNGEFDRAEAARHYGLAESYLEPAGDAPGAPSAAPPEAADRSTHPSGTTRRRSARGSRRG